MIRDPRIISLLMMRIRVYPSGKGFFADAGARMKIFLILAAKRPV
jgi:hypothetical protein